MLIYPASAESDILKLMDALAIDYLAFEAAPNWAVLILSCWAMLLSCFLGPYIMLWRSCLFDGMLEGIAEGLTFI